MALRIPKALEEEARLYYELSVELSLIPQRGDVIWITLNPHAGDEQAGRRAAFVLSPRAYNDKVGLAILCPITSQVKGYPFEVRIPDGPPARGVLLANQVKSLGWRARQAEQMCTLSPDAIVEVLAELGVLLDQFREGIE